MPLAGRSSRPILAPRKQNFSSVLRRSLIRTEVRFPVLERALVDGSDGVRECARPLLIFRRFSSRPDDYCVCERFCFSVGDSLRYEWDYSAAARKVERRSSLADKTSLRRVAGSGARESESVVPRMNLVLQSPAPAALTCFRAKVSLIMNIFRFAYSLKPLDTRIRTNRRRKRPDLAQC